MSQKYYCYKITNLINGKIYIGKAKNIRTRWNSHKTAARAQDPKDFAILHRAMLKYSTVKDDGKITFDNFMIEQISEHDTEKEALAQETAFIKQYGSRDRDIGYNMTDGGDGVIGYQATPEQRQRMSERRKGKYVGENNPFYGKEHSVETRKVISEKAIERYNNNKEKYDEINIQQCNLNTEQCLEIQRKYLQGDNSFEEIAKIYSTNIRAIHNIITGNYIAIRGKSLISEEMFKQIKKDRKHIQNLKSRAMNPEQELNIVEQYQNGANSYEIGEQYGVSNVTILKILKEHNINIRQYQGGKKKELQNGNTELAVVADYKNMSIKQLSDKYKISKDSIRNILKQHNVVLRTGRRKIHVM